MINGIHHITALASVPQKNLDFYTKLLGLRFIKRTVNFDAPNIYHLYYGDYYGTPGSVLTFFPYKGIYQGRRGNGQITFISFSVSKDSLLFWKERLTESGVFITEFERFNQNGIRFSDYDGLGLEIIENENDKREWEFNNGVKKNHLIKGFHSATIDVLRKDVTSDLLINLFGYEIQDEDVDRIRFKQNNVAPDYIDLTTTKEKRGLEGGGTIHHLAFCVETYEEQFEIREKLIEFGYHPTIVLDRKYFKSIYFRDPNGILFEIATKDPGFSVDEDISELGNSLKLPHWQEENREFIEKSLPLLVL